ncbi:MAG: isoprenylcysteine carboxylmethyltransferase family protein [Rhodobacteraceae bacterium]|nr:isoprenylcysteine carboxylmethyltransferase family protein [Paracoccaceae bacterium]
MADRIPVSAHAYPWKISDVVLFPAFAAGGVIEWLFPLHIPFLPAPLRWTLGATLAALGVGLIIWSKRALDAAGQPSLPGTPTTRLVMTAPFSFSRNPNYLGALTTGLGGALLVNAPWLIVAGLVAGAILQVWMIRPEEVYLRSRFGAEYADYCRRVRRWL